MSLVLQSLFPPLSYDLTEASLIRWF
jgi:hypothetical protein